MFKIICLYTEPELIKPIDFSDGINLIVGEEDESSAKNNGVGKSLCIEFINFALLKTKSSSRVSLIPADSFPPATYVCLKFVIDDVEYLIKRSLAEAEQPTLISNYEAMKFSKLEDATKFLTEKIFSKAEIQYPSFRSMLGPLIRDERSEFRSIVQCYDKKVSQRIPDDYAPHLYLFNIDVSIYNDIKKCLTEISQIKSDIQRIRENVFLLRQKKVEDARSDLNDLDSEVSAIEASIDKLENTVGYDIIKEETLKIEMQMENFRRQRGLLKKNLSKIKPISKKIDIEIPEILEFYNQLKNRLGELVVHDLKEVLQFKEKIDIFQNQLLSERRKSILEEVDFLDKSISILDKQYSANLSILDQKGSLRNLKQTFLALKEKSDAASQLRVFIERYESLEALKQEIKSKKEANLLHFQSQLLSVKSLTEDFEKTILSIHEFIQGNRKASFDIKKTNNAKIVDIVMRIDDDGSHSVDREKVFIYDIALLLNRYTKQRHLGFLIHDNILDVDQDTLLKNIKYLCERAMFDQNQQYILTLNTDRLNINKEKEPWLANLDIYVKARFTKKNRFLKKKYQEKNS